MQFKTFDLTPSRKAVSDVEREEEMSRERRGKGVGEDGQEEMNEREGLTPSLPWTQLKVYHGPSCCVLLILRHLPEHY